MKIALDYAARSDVGLVRSENQDSGYAGPHLLVVADGMGGHAGGDIASSIAIGRMVSLDGESHGGDDATDHLVRSLAAANTQIQEQVEHSPELQGMGTTRHRPAAGRQQGRPRAHRRLAGLPPAR